MAKANTSNKPTSQKSPPDEKPGVKKNRYTGHITMGQSGKSAGGDRFMELCFEDKGRAKTHILPLTDLTERSPAFRALTRTGANLISGAARRELINRLQDHDATGPELMIATRLGWHGDNFVLPRSKAGPGRKNIRVYLEDSRPERYDRYRVGGNLDGWQELAKAAEGNSRLILPIAVAFSGPVAALLRLEQIGIMLVGAPEAGKTTAAIAAGSVWGCHADANMATRLGFAEPFNATENDLEDELLAANHTLLAVDETRSAGLGDREIGRMLVNLAMRWEIGFEKGRKNAVGIRQAASVPFILTSNLSLGQFAAEAGKKVDDAVHGRLISIPLPKQAQGLYETLHDHEDVVAFSRYLRTLATTHFGHPSREFLKALVYEHSTNRSALKAWLEKRRAYYLGKAHALETPGRHTNRIHEKMATVYAAARFAIKHEILPWDSKLVRESLLACTIAHIGLVASEIGLEDASKNQSLPGKSRDPEVLVVQLQRFVAENRESVVNLQDGVPQDESLPGKSECPVFIQQSKKGKREYLFTHERLLSLLGTSSDVQVVKAYLAKRKLIATDTGADRTIRYSVKRSVPTKGRTQFVAIDAAVFEDQRK